jgi:hypothetical protein
VFGQAHGFWRCHVHREVELAAALAAAGGVVEAPETGCDIRDGEARLLQYLAGERLAEAFAVFDLAAGQFPDASHEVGPGALEQEHVTVVLDDRADDKLLDAVGCGAPDEVREYFSW